MTSALRLATATFVVALASIGFSPAAHADTTSRLTPSIEAWYQANPTCAQASGCVGLGSLPSLPVDVPLPLSSIPLSPFPAGTLDVGYTAGQETARTYLALPVSSVTGEITSAKLTVPLDTATADGSELPETAHVQVCLFTGTITATEGSIAEPPIAACDRHASAKYVATPTPHLEAVLGPLKDGLLTTEGIVLLPDSTVTASDAWRVVFSAHTRTDAAKTAPATVALTLAPLTSTPVAVPTIEPIAPAVVNGAGQVIAPPTGSSGLGAVSGAAPVTDGQAPTIDVPAPVTQNQPVVQAASPRTITFGYSYPLVWVLPIVFLVVVPAVARAITRDLTPREAPEGEA